MARKSSSQARRIYKSGNSYVVLHQGRRYSIPRRCSDIDLTQEVTVMSLQVEGFCLAHVTQGEITELWTST